METKQKGSNMLHRNNLEHFGVHLSQQSTKSHPHLYFQPNLLLLGAFHTFPHQITLKTHQFLTELSCCIKTEEDEGFRTNSSSPELSTVIFKSIIFMVDVQPHSTSLRLHQDIKVWYSHINKQETPKKIHQQRTIRRS